MPITPYPDVDALLHSLLAQLEQILGPKLVGLYLYGSLVTGDFDRRTSDIDLLAAISSDLDDSEFAQLDQLHQDLIAAYPFWRNRLEIGYLSTAALKTFRMEVSTIAIISPGEPFHRKPAGKDWLLNWWVVREQSVTLFGPPPSDVIDPISRDEFLEVVREHARSWREWLGDMCNRPGQAYAIVTLCRAMYAVAHGRQDSKLQAARWAQVRFPEWAALIEQALQWRLNWRDDVVDHAATFPDTARFVDFASELVAGETGDGRRET